jgi:His-Xaa-Ser system radical SAM maturase HxsC
VVTDPAERAHTVRIVPDSLDEPLDGYLAVLAPSAPASIRLTGPAVVGCAVEHLSDGDVVKISANGRVQTLYRRRSPHNSLFTTDRCNSYCLMCSQPPIDVDDGWRVDELLRLVALIDTETQELGITGGEPTLLGDGLLRIISACRHHLPATSLHLLSNGRRFMYGSYADALGRLQHPDLMVGVPLYSDLDYVHDYVVQARGAYTQTIFGLHNLCRASVPVEVRVVVHSETYGRLPQLARFIYRNLTFASHVAIMGLEITGFAKANLRALWVDPADYQHELEEAVEFLAAAGLQVSIYNHQLCTVPRSVREFCRRSISDWKNEYEPECNTCRIREECGGFFRWNTQDGKSRLFGPVLT